MQEGRPAASGPSLLDLPLDLLQRLMVMIEAECGIEEVAKCRLLSKSWCNVFAQYKGWSADISLRPKETDNLRTVCKLLPHMSSLELRAGSKKIDFSPIASLTQLTSLDLYTYLDVTSNPIQETIVSTQPLPASLKKLTLRSAELRHMNELHLPQLTWLNIYLEEEGGDVLALLTKLLHLKELQICSLESAKDCGLEEVFRGAFEGPPALTKLKLHSGKLVLGPSSLSRQRLSGLRELSLSTVYVNKSWLGLLSRELTCITKFSLDSCKIHRGDNWDGTEIKTTMKTLKVLKLKDSSPVFLHVADAKLPELYLDKQYCDTTQLPNPYRHLQRLTSLTKLVIIDFWDADNLILPRLDSVVELGLLNLEGYFEQTFFVSGCLTSLQKLHLEFCEVQWLDYGSYTLEKDDVSDEEATHSGSQWLLTADALQSLPQLSQISAYGSYSVGRLGQLLSDWELADVPSRSIKIPRYDRGITISMWTKTTL